MIGTAAGIGAALGAAALAYATQIEPYQLDVKRLELALPRLPKALEGLTVLHLSDVHAKHHDARAAAVVEAAARIQADLVCLTGDYGDVPRDAPLALDQLRDARGRLGTFAVLGNHDFDARPRHRPWPHRFSADAAARVVALMETQGIVVLRNESARLCIAGTPLYVLGVDDPHTFHDDVWRAYRGVPSGTPSIFLAHSWEPTPTAGEHGAMLALAGHSHGGQIRLPFLPPPVHNCHRPPPRIGGLSWVGETALHVSQGLGGTFTIRLLVRPQAVLLTLRSLSSRRAGE